IRSVIEELIEFLLHQIQRDCLRLLDGSRIGGHGWLCGSGPWAKNGSSALLDAGLHGSLGLCDRVLLIRYLFEEVFIVRRCLELVLQICWVGYQGSDILLKGNPWGGELYRNNGLNCTSPASPSPPQRFI